MWLASMNVMLDPHDLQIVIILALIPMIIAGMYSLVEMAESIRNRVSGRGRARAASRKP